MSQSAEPAPIEMVYEIAPQLERWELRDEEVMPEPVLQDNEARDLVLVLKHRIATERIDASTGCHLALRWDREHPTVGVDPDVYLVEPAVPLDTTSLLLWEPGRRPPRLAVEIVSRNTADVDYLDKPERYAASGTRELWIFDPLLLGPALVAHVGPYRLQVWRRVAGGQFKRVHAGEGPAYSRELGAWIVVTDDGRRIRIADDRAGKRLWPTAEEAERKAREAAEAARETEKKAREAAEAARETEKKAREVAERTAQNAVFDTLCGLYAQRLGRPLAEGERAALQRRFVELGAESVGAMLFTLEPDALVAWLRG